jgi:hypothetical protein
MRRLALIGEPSLLWIIQPQISPPRLSVARSAPVKTPTTPGIAAAAGVDLSSAWHGHAASAGNRHEAWPGRLMSSV